MWGKVWDHDRLEQRAWLPRLLVAAGVAAGGVLTGFLLWPEPQAHAAAAAAISVAGASVELNGDPAEQGRLLARRYLDQPIALRLGDKRDVLTRAELGVRVDASHLTALLSQAADAHSPLRRLHAQTSRGDALALPMPIELDQARATERLLRLKDQIDHAPVEARVDPREQRVHNAQNGEVVDVFATLEALDHALRSGATQVPLVVQTVAPKLAAQDFSHVDMHAVLGEFETAYNRGNTSEDRTHNLKTAAAKIDGYVVQPGQEFDFNAVVGDRTPSNGYRLAPVIADGELTSGMGGGTCQIASTLHAAVFFSGLPIVTRFPHSRPSFYIKLGLDATVVYGAQNFKFKNDRSYPIVLGMSVREGHVEASIHGPARDHTVTFIRHVDATLPFEEHETSDASLPFGLRVLTQRGVPGFRTTRFRITQDERTHIAVRERTSDLYPPTSQLWRIGKGTQAPAEFARPKNDAHPEYVADEYLQVTQTPERGTYEALRDPGRMGVYGWTEREGMIVR